MLHKKELARESRCDVALHGSVVSWDETVPWQLESSQDIPDDHAEPSVALAVRQGSADEITSLATDPDR